MESSAASSPWRSSTSPVIAWLAACFKLPVVGVDHLLNRFHYLRPDALDLFQFFGRHGTEFFHGGYARLHQLLGQLFTQAVIDEYRDWRSGSHQSGHRRLYLLPLFLFALDIDSPAKQFGREPYILPLLPNRQRKLQVIYDHFHVLSYRIDDHHETTS